MIPLQFGFLIISLTFASIQLRSPNTEWTQMYELTDRESSVSSWFNIIGEIKYSIEINTYMPIFSRISKAVLNTTININQQYPTSLDSMRKINQNPELKVQMKDGNCTTKIVEFQSIRLIIIQTLVFISIILFEMFDQVNPVNKKEFIKFLKNTPNLPHHHPQLSNPHDKENLPHSHNHPHNMPLEVAKDKPKKKNRIMEGNFDKIGEAYILEGEYLRKKQIYEDQLEKTRRIGAQEEQKCQSNAEFQKKLSKLRYLKEKGLLKPEQEELLAKCQQEFIKPTMKNEGALSRNYNTSNDPYLSHRDFQGYHSQRQIYQPQMNQYFN